MGLWDAIQRRDAGAEHEATGRGPDGRPPRGFTLIEVLIAISVLAGLTAIVWVTINNMFRTRNFMTERYERFQIIRVAMDRMTSELASAYHAGPSHGAERRYEDKKPAAAAASGAQSDQQQAEQQAQEMIKAWREPVQFGMDGDSDELNFTSFAHLRMFRGERSSYHAEIGYFVETRRSEDGDMVKSLMRREDITIDDDITQGGKVYTLIPNIESVEFEYWDPGEVVIGDQQENARGQWQDDWDTSKRQYYKRLPTRVRITITLPPQTARRGEETFSTQTEIMIHERLEF